MEYNFTNIQIKILEGCLMGDGHLELHKHGKNAALSYISSSKQHVEFVHSFFKEFCTDNYQEVKRGEFFDKRTKKTYVNYKFRTKCLPIFTEQHNRFYKNRVKIVPKDLEIDNNLLLFWYIGDGELEKKNGYIKLHTNSFTLEEIEILCKKLYMFDPTISKKTFEQFIISIPRRKVKIFLEFIGKCPFIDYKHKWTFVEYKNKNIENNGISYYHEFFPLMEKEYLSGNYSQINKLCKKYNVPLPCLKNYLKSKNIAWITSGSKKKIEQYDLNNNLIKEWSSGEEIKKQLNYDNSAISACCRGARKKHKNFIWKFKN